MAVMNPIQQRLLMERMRRDPRLAALIAARQQGGGGLAELAGMPEGATNLAALAGLAPEAQVVTPAQPAPVEPGVELKMPDKLAPDDTPLDERTAQQVARDRINAVAADTEGGQAAFQQATGIQAGEPKEDKDEEVGIQEAARRAAMAVEAAVVGAEKLTPEMQDVYAKRGARYSEQLADLDADRKRAGWEALATAGFRMAQSQSPYFMSALASGMEAGLTGFNAKKMERAERKARLQAAQEQIVLDQEAAKIAAGARERQRQLGFLGTQEAVMKLGREGLTNEILRQAFPYEVKAAQYKPGKAAAEVASEEAEAELRRSQADYYRSGAGRGAGGEGVDQSTGLKLTKIADLLRTAETNKARLEAKLATPLLDPKVIKDLNNKIKLANADIAQYRRLLKLGSVSAVPKDEVSGGGGSKAAFRYDPKTGKLIPNR